MLFISTPLSLLCTGCSVLSCVAGLVGRRKSEQSGEHKASQGIVMAAGKAMRLGNAYVTLRVLRDHMHSNLPVEIWYLGTEEMDVATEAGLEVTRSLSHSPPPCPVLAAHVWYAHCLWFDQSLAVG